MKRIYSVGLALACALVFTTLVLFGYQQQAAAQTVAQPEEAEGEIVAITPLRLDGQVVLSVTVRVGEDLTVTTPITLDVASWVADLDGATEITAAVAVGEPATTITGAMTAVVTSTLTTTVDVAVTGLITPVLSLVELLDEDDMDEEEEAEPVLQGEVLFPSNLREGPGTDTPVIGSAQPGDIVVIVDTNAAGDWYNLESGEWIAGFLVQLLEPEEITEPEDEELPPEEADAEEADTEDVDAEDVDEADETPAPAPTAMPVPEEEDTEVAATESTATESTADASLEYRVEVITGLLNLASGVEAMGDLMDDPQILSAAWNDNIKGQATVIQGSFQTISALTPPSTAASFHAALLSALGDCDVAMDLLTDGLDSLDMEALDQAAALLIQCGSKMETVIADYPEILE